MKRMIVHSGLMAVGVAAFVMFAGAAAGTPEGKTIFLSKKCNSCHAVASQSIEHTVATSKAPDLSKIGAVQNADWIKGWLLRTEELRGKKHVKKWSGTDAQLTKLVAWLATLKR